MTIIKAQGRVRCIQCNDFGLVRVTSRSENIETLMRCDCEVGQDQVWELPRWHRDCSNQFSRTPCPLEWFKPSKLDDLKESKASLQQQAEYWRNKVRIAEQFWKGEQA